MSGSADSRSLAAPRAPRDPTDSIVGVAAHSHGRVNPEVAALLRTIGRGARGSRGLNIEQAQILMGWLLRRELSDAQIGGSLMALRMKGESAEELEGFTRAVRAALPLIAPRTRRPVVVIPSANGARRLPNQVPLLAALLREQGVPVLVTAALPDDPARLPTAQLWAALGMPVASTPTQAQGLLEQGEAVLLPLAALSPELDTLLQWRGVLGVRNAGHSIVKLLNPLETPSLLVTGYTHPDYAVLMRDVLQGLRQPALLLRGCEGEAVAHPHRDAERIGLFADGSAQTWPPGAAFSPAAELPDGLDLARSSAWIHAVMNGHKPPPAPLVRQLACIRAMHDSLAAGPAARPQPRAETQSTQSSDPSLSGVRHAHST